MIPLSKPYVDQEIKDAILKVIDSGQYILGHECKEFEKEFAQFVGVKHAILTNSGTTAIFLTLKALGVGPGDEILVPSLTAFPTVEPIYHVGAQPIFIDIDETFTMSLQHLEIILNHRQSLSGKVKGILPVHLYGHPADMDSILNLAKKHDIFVLEDSCQAHGAKYKGKRVGSIGIAGCFSFYPSKNMTVLGDGGLIVTDDDKLAETCKMLRDHGRTDKYKHDLIGYNLRFNEIQGAIGRIQLARLDEFNRKRREISLWYKEGLTGVPVIIPKDMDWVEPVYHLYVIQTSYRDNLGEFLKSKGIQTGVHYPIPCHCQPAVLDTHYPQFKLKKTEEVVDKIISLPMYPELTKSQVDFICKNIRDFFSEPISER